MKAGLLRVAIHWVVLLLSIVSIVVIFLRPVSFLSVVPSGILILQNFAGNMTWYRAKVWFICKMVRQKVPIIPIVCLRLQFLQGNYMIWFQRKCLRLIAYLMLMGIMKLSTNAIIISVIGWEKSGSLRKNLILFVYDGQRVFFLSLFGYILKFPRDYPNRKFNCNALKCGIMNR